MLKIHCYKSYAFILIGSILLVSSLFAQTEWTKHENNPVLKPSPIGFVALWDDRAVGFPCVMYDGTMYKMWFHGDGVSVQGYGQIGYAESFDGVNWEKYAENPVLKLGAEGEWDQEWVQAPVVIFDGTEYKMWYHGGLTTGAIGHATSPDGKVWTKHENNPVLIPGENWDEGSLFTGDVIFDGSIYKMWYSGKINGAGLIGYAESVDGVNWQKYGGNPVLKLGELAWEGPAWDGVTVYKPGVMFADGTYHMWYSGRESGNIRLGYATSPDGKTWTKYDNNPVLDIVENSWESKWLAAPSVIKKDDGSLQMWYLGGYAWNKSSIGYATSSMPISDVSRRSFAGKNGLPQEYILLDNYPNPFNPTTTIRYNLPELAHIRLTIYDQLGRHVRTLVDAQQAAGHFQTAWNGLDEKGVPAAAGMYFCQMKAHNFTKAIKLALVK